MTSGTSAKNRTLAELLIAKQILSEAECAAAYERQEATDCSFEEAIVGLGYLSPSDLAAFLSNESQVRVLKLEDIEIDREAVCHVPAAVARRYRLIPVRRSGNSLAVAMQDTAEAAALEALRQVTDFDIIPFAAREDAIEHAIYLHYGEDGSDRHASAPPARQAGLRAYPEDDRFGHQAKGWPLKRRQTLDRMVEDAANQFALSIARSICSSTPEDGYNPFLCWGPRGSGKTHLLNAIGSQLAAQVPAKRFVFTSASDFTENLYECIRDGKLNFFRYLYRELDMLLLDDAHTISSYLWVQRELVETFRYLARHGGRLVLASDTNLSVEPATIPELRACLESGVIASIGEYSTSARYEIARHWKGSVDVPEEILRFIAADCGADLVEMIAVLQQTVVLAAQGESEVTRDMVEELVHLCGIAAARTTPAPSAPAFSEPLVEDNIHAITGDVSLGRIGANPRKSIHDSE